MGCLLSVGVGLSESNVNLCYLVCALRKVQIIIKIVLGNNASSCKPRLVSVWLFKYCRSVVVVGMAHIVVN